MIFAIESRKFCEKLGYICHIYIFYVWKICGIHMISKESYNAFFVLLEILLSIK